jgi:hypothetical protein
MRATPALCLPFFHPQPSSGPCERVCSLVESMFGHEQLSSLADMLQGSVMLRYSERAVG